MDIVDDLAGMMQEHIVLLCDWSRSDVLAKIVAHHRPLQSAAQ
jgi:hypothetical protein